METSLYGDQDYTVYRPPSDIMLNVQQIKKRMTLDLEQRPTKRQRTEQMLTSPDINMLKLASPELERFITQHGLPTTPTPGNQQALGAVFGRPVTEEQENYARGFVDALHHLKQQEQEYASAVTNSVGSEPGYPASEPSPVYTQLESSSGSIGGGFPVAIGAVTSTCPSSLPGQPGYYGGGNGRFTAFDGVQIKEEPQTVPSLPTVPTPASTCSSQPPSPVDMQQQELIKLERKRLRNRIAATKCRKRKLERIARLEERVAQIKRDNSDLAAVASRLREQVMSLKKEVAQHAQNGCQILTPR